MLSVKKGICKFDYSRDQQWERGFLKQKCKEVGVEEEYLLYERRLLSNALTVFLFLHAVVTLVECLLLLVTCEYRDIIYIDVGCYIICAAITTLVLSINFNQRISENYGWVKYATSAFAVFLMFVVDAFLHLYHYYVDYWMIGSFYDTYALFMIYLFLPVPSMQGPLILGCAVSLTYLVYFVMNFSSKYHDELDNSFIISFFLMDVGHYVCFNMLGCFFRFTNDIIVRSSFLDRHQYVMEKIWLRTARHQEKLLLHSILPPQIAQPFQDDIRSRVALPGKRRDFREQTVAKCIMTIQSHTDVSIMFADVVNYTHLTTTLTVKALVTLLHDLYARFDVAASHFKVQRIRFLGDCYYCVAGLSKPNPDHAQCCIDLGHCMIAHIREVRFNRNLDIDMRIGVHSGALYAGVIGTAKLQYDIWGDDVMIATQLEATGVPGHVHISDRTLGMVFNKTYKILPGTQEARQDDYLRKRNIKTYLIPAIDIQKTFSDEDMRIDIKPSHLETTHSIKSELHFEFQQLPVGACQCDRIMNFFRSFAGNTIIKRTKERIHPKMGIFLLNFHDPRLDYNFMRQTDYTFKYNLLLAWCVAGNLFFVQIINQKSAEYGSYMVGVLDMATNTALVCIIWYKSVCNWLYRSKYRDFSSMSCFIFRVADHMQRNLICRICIYMSTIVGYFSVIAVLLMHCNQDEYEVLNIESKLYLYEPDLDICFHPWVLTNAVCLIMAMSIIFTNIPWMVKIIVSVFEALSYVIIMFFQFEYIIHHSLTTNPFLLSEYAHTYIISIIFVSLYLIARQAEFNTKINYNWRMELLKKQEDALITKKSITILLQNILPAHVVPIFLNTKHQLYHEDYKMVAVMFASLGNFSFDLPNLRVLNEVITEFDRILTYYRKHLLVEKIKIVGCTYMAACGLDPRYSGNLNDLNDGQDSVMQEVNRAKRFQQSIHNTNCQTEDVPNEHVVFVLTTFALDLMRTIWMFNLSYKNLPLARVVFTGDMSIGISSGEVMAGVVGASQVHYDIWGDPVNMASRMVTTGVAGRIQVTEESAHILKSYGIECEYRGMTFVKGRGLLPTYFVGIDDNYEFLPVTDDDSS